MSKKYIVFVILLAATGEVLAQNAVDRKVSYCSQLDSYDLHFFLGHSEEACIQMIASLSDKIRENPRNPNFYFLRGMNKSELNDNRGAIYDFNEALIILNTKPDKKDGVGLLHVNTYLAKSKSHGMLKDFEGAIKSANDALQMALAIGAGPSLMDKVYYFRGGAYIFSGDLDEGCKSMSKAGENGCERAYEIIKARCQ